MTTYRFADATPRFVDVGHSDVAVRQFGQGPDLVLVHGWPLHGATYRDLVPHLAEQFTCHVIDLPGAGLTRCRDPKAIELGRHAETVGATIDALGIGRYALLGHDSGAMVTRLVAHQHGERVAGSVMCNTEIPGHVPWQPMLYKAAGAVPLGDAIFKLLLRNRWFRGTDAAFGACFEDMRLLDGAFGDLFIQPLLNDRAALDGAMALIRNFDQKLMKGLGRIHREMTAPSLLIWGANDPFFPLAKAEKMLSQFTAGAELEVLRPGKLFVHEERPADVARRALPFLERCFRTPDVRAA